MTPNFTSVIHIKDVPPQWKNDSRYVYIGRKGKGVDGYFGNPYRLKKGEQKGASLSRYEDYFYKRLETDPEFARRIRSLKGKVLVCFCKPRPCHGDVIVEYLNRCSCHHPVDWTEHGEILRDNLTPVDHTPNGRPIYALEDVEKLMIVPPDRTCPFCQKEPTDG